MAQADDASCPAESKGSSLEQAKKNFEFFWRKDSPFSQWHKAKFSVDGQLYNCAEQFMMHQKAVLFGDHAVAEKILTSKDPRAQKSLGRKVKNFDEAAWTGECFNIVKRGNRAKFSQNDSLKSILFATHPRTLVEASPVDTIWGIGLSEDNPLAWDRSTWQGKNLLGLALTEVRDELMGEEQLQV
ncbi:hypothetical protein C0Q70_17073 [Pomacea canaliculata]|uniref:NADAR domain-containing protein n=1 Tax=Pomacea canaliculata TaxID=400727 RepID=A0A2T7NRJ5_POMCA|nr:uncharacterized protein LOC112574387 [Pomacea canaliculata]PVD23799.1 hypothetical protein C0Q70_17073 [Pomacea canaliculata]